MSLPSCGKDFASMIRHVYLSPTSRPSLSFLYSTESITKYCARRTQRTLHQMTRDRRRHEEEEAMRHRRVEDENVEPIPFESSKASHRPDRRESDILNDEGASTITDAERRVFEQVFYDAATRKAQTQAKSRAAQAINGHAPKTYADRGLSAAMDEAIASFEMAQQKQNQSYNGHPQAERASKEPSKNKSKPGQRQFVSKSDLKRPQQQAEYRRVEDLLLEAQTDVELWNILEREVFAAVKAMKLDPDTEKSAEESAETPLATLGDLPHHQPAYGIPDPSLIGPNYPMFMVTAIRQLRHEFPDSSLPHNIVPRMKELGPTSFVLGASTALYNELIMIKWQKYGDIPGIVHLLQEMTQEFIPQDHRTVQILEAIEKQAERARAGQEGKTTASIWKMDRYSTGRLAQWKAFIEDTLNTTDPERSLDAMFAALASKGYGVGTGRSNTPASQI